MSLTARQNVFSLSPVFFPLIAQVIADLVVLVSQGVVDELAGLVAFLGRPSTLGLAPRGRGLKVVGVSCLPDRHPEGGWLGGIALFNPQPQSFGPDRVGAFQVHQRSRDPLDASPEGLAFLADV